DLVPVDAARVLADEPFPFARRGHWQEENPLREEPDAALGRPLVLPGEERTERLARAAKDRRRAALVRDADGGEVARRQPGAGERTRRDAARRSEDDAGILLDPAGLRERRGELLVRGRDDGSARVDDGCADAGRPLVEPEDVLLSRLRHRGRVPRRAETRNPASAGRRS